MELIQLVMTYSEGDGCTYSCTETIPFRYESLEAARLDFDILAKNNHEQAEGGFHGFPFAGRTYFGYTYFEAGKYYPPTIQSLQDWFESNLE